MRFLKICILGVVLVLGTSCGSDIKKNGNGISNKDSGHEIVQSFSEESILAGELPLVSGAHESFVYTKKSRYFIQIVSDCGEAESRVYLDDLVDYYETGNAASSIEQNQEIITTAYVHKFSPLSCALDIISISPSGTLCLEKTIDCPLRHERSGFIQYAYEE